MFTLTPDILNKIAPSIKGTKAINIAQLLTDICPKYGIDSADIFHEFIANVLHECAEFKIFKENLNYSALALVRTWPSRFPSLAQAAPFERQPQKIAERVYSGRMGNVHPGDAWKFIGSGPIQLTGRDMVTLFTVFYNKKFESAFTVEQMADLLRNDLRIGIHSACWFFAHAKKLIEFAANDNMREVVRRINGGYNGLNDRMKYYERAKLFIK